MSRLSDRFSKEVSETGAPVDYDAQNYELFTRRREIKEAIAELEAKPRLGSRQRAQLGRLRRELDDVTTGIFQFNFGLVRSYTRRFTSKSSQEDSDDFEAAAIEGLMKAIESFDPDKGRFGAWAYKPIQRKVLRAVRDADYKSMTPGDFETRPEIKRAWATLAGENESYTPTYEEVAAEAGVTVDRVRRVLDAPHLDSIHQMVGEDGDTELGDLIEAGDPGIDATVLSAMALTALETYGLPALDVRELMVLVRRFGLDGEPSQHLASIGTMLGLSREAVRQVEAKALAKIQHPVIIRKIYRDGR